MPDAAVHDCFTLTRSYKHAPAKVFAAFATEEGKERWFSGPNDQWDRTDRQFDFRVGGIETIEGVWKNGMISRMDLVYHDIVPDRRIVYAYGMKINGTPISVSLATLELTPDGAGTRLTLTEHGVYLDGFEDGGGREHGTNELIDKMGATLPA